jgi:hypothetical protein
MRDISSQINYMFDKPYLTPVLLAAGMIPQFIALFNLSRVLQFAQLLYFIVLIPPAAYHCWRWLTSVSKRKPHTKP